ncbi:MAG: DUF493 domain-containing protein [Desulfarculus sp.]|nr:DUF493 domain-containing protein [Desulfarculus sp.]
MNDSPAEPILTQEALRLLERFHDFPGDYIFKVIGFGAEEFTAAVRQAAEAVLGPLADAGGQLHSRPSRGGRYTAVSLEVKVVDARQVLEVYSALKRVQGVVVLV